PDAPVVFVAAAVENDPHDTLLQGALAEDPPHFPGGLHVARASLATPQRGFEGRRRHQGDPGVVIDELGVHVPQAAINGQARPLGGPAAFAPYPPLPPPTSRQFARYDGHFVHSLLPAAARPDQCRPTANGPCPCRSCRPCAGCARPRRKSPCPGTARAAARPGCPRPPDPPAACRCRAR